MRLRRVEAADGERVQQFVRGLSSRSRRERFFAPVVELSARELERIVAGPGASLAAVDEQERIVALAEYARLPGREAEFAIAVADAWQGQGIGEQVLAALLDDAARAGIVRFQGITRAGNRAMRLLAGRLGFRTHADDEDPDFVRLERVLSA